MAVGIEHLGQRQVVAGPHGRPGAHGHAETGRTRLGALRRHQEGPLATPAIRRVAVHPAGQHPVLDRNGPQVARAHTEERVRRRWCPVLGHHQFAVGTAIGCPLPFPRWVQKRLPGLRARAVREHGTVLAGTKPIDACLQLDSPAVGEFRTPGDFGQDDRPVAYGRSHDRTATPGQDRDQRIQSVLADHRGHAAVVRHRQPSDAADDVCPASMCTDLLPAWAARPLRGPGGCLHHPVRTPSGPGTTGGPVRQEEVNE